MKYKKPFVKEIFQVYECTISFEYEDVKLNYMDISRAFQTQ